MSTLDRPCEDWLERVSAHLDGELSEAEDRAVQEHLETCPRCRAWAEAAKADAERFAAAYGRSAEEGNLRGQVLDRIAASMREPQPWWRSSQAWLSRLVALCAIVVLGMILLAVVPPVLRSREHAQKPVCINNQKQILAAAIAFAADSEGRLPRAVAWNAYLVPYLKDAEEVFHCPSADPSVNAGYDYAYNPTLSGKPTSAFAQPAEAVMIFDADDGHAAWRHHGGAIFGYADGHVRWQRRPGGAQTGAPATEPEQPLSVPIGVQAAPRGL